jgi:hypothetical protein
MGGERSWLSWPVELLLSGQLLLVVPPGADLQTATDPAQGLRLFGRSIRATNGAFQRFLHHVVGHRPLRRFQNFRWNHGFGLDLRFSSHTDTPSISETVSEHNWGNLLLTPLPGTALPALHPAPTRTLSTSDLAPPAVSCRRSRPRLPPCECRSDSKPKPWLSLPNSFASDPPFSSVIQTRTGTKRFSKKCVNLKCRPKAQRCPALTGLPS